MESDRTENLVAETDLDEARDQASAREIFIESLGKTVHAIILDLSSDPIFCFNREGIYLYVNRAFATPLRRHPNDIIGHRIWDIFPGEGGDMRFSTVRMAFETGEAQEIEVMVPSTPVSWYLTTATPVADAMGAPQVVICISKNITQRKLLEQALYERSIHDGHTRLFNRQYLLERLEGCITSWKTTREAFCMLLIDLDWFKRINDAHGHVVGDEVLLEFSSQLQACFPDNCWVSRYGGEEFAVLLPATRLEPAMHQAESLRRVIEARRFTHMELPLTISIGVAEFADTGVRSFMERLDNFLYQAKHMGRNRVVG